ncbi:protein MAIN-LIKE 2-like [Vicia villosa]|uniref:protein MAIN-LIKE 2-like n=1 Tax=Vicia villosa TaxID=3911 RepID=UPI00273B2DA1|nr:protein MAIN-LIKE 2-like [Vicia villosa]
MEEVPGGSSFGLRSRLARASSSREVEEEEVEEHQKEVEAPEEEGVPEVKAPENDVDVQDDEQEGYLGGPSDTSLLIYYHDHIAQRVWEREERPTIKSVNLSWKIFNLFIPQAQWFNNVVVASGLGGLYMTGYSTISHDMQGKYAKRWNKETSSFHFPIGGLTITIYDVACMLPFMAERECSVTNGAHIQFSSLRELYENHLVAEAETEEEGDALFVEYHRAYALRCWFMFLVGTVLFMDKSATNVDMTYL